MQIKRSVTVGCDTSFRCRSIWEEPASDSSSGKRGNYIYEKNSISQENTLNGRENYPSGDEFFLWFSWFCSFFGRRVSRYRV